MRLTTLISHFRVDVSHRKGRDLDLRNMVQAMYSNDTYDLLCLAME
ncbi:hypothetical protein ACFL1X_14005 [Candidatus Hydrogenedentota bacterium]